jgi:aspartyl-tRNA(Asn)/glutamyl-tRNA(Gln) amidotransferase subunit C
MANTDDSTQLTTEEVAHVAHLARLAVSPADLERYATQLSSILDYVHHLSEVDTTSVEPIGQISGLTNVLGSDEPAADPIDMSDFLSAAPASETPYVKVKAVLE